MILSLLCISSSLSIVLHTFFLRNDRLESIDREVRQAATILVSSKLGDLEKIDLADAESIISEELGENRIGKFFIIRDEQGHVIYESPNVKLLGLTSIPQTPKWIELKKRSDYIRILNLQLPRYPDRTLQVGLVYDEDLVSPNYFSGYSAVFFILILSFGSVISYILTSFLLKPISQLKSYLSTVSEKAKIQPLLERVPASILLTGLTSAQEEFGQLISQINLLIDRVNLNHRLSRLWVYALAHELKTPLAVMRLDVEKENLVALKAESSQLSETLNSFLGWAELENSLPQKPFYAQKLADVLNKIISKLQAPEKNRLKAIIETDEIVFSSLEHLEQVFSNLISNALKYSKPLSLIEIKLEGFVLSISNEGEPIPQRVIDRIGQPFNRGEGNQLRGHGLGLAWVSSICKSYFWDLEIAPIERTTLLTIRFSNILFEKSKDQDSLEFS